MKKIQLLGYSTFVFLCGKIIFALVICPRSSIIDVSIYKINDKFVNSRLFCPFTVYDPVWYF
ncbi:MAG: hypothetical protein KGD68_11615 [Candidatus Lokiarchaeota archaeon]|nr:hypothetical protein [Candidatus Lokiarchaeota archaeon]